MLVEVGPQQALTNLHRRILSSQNIAMIASDQPKRPGVEQLLCVEAILDCAGALEPAAAGRLPRAAAAMRPRRPPSRSRASAILAFDATARRREKMRRAGGDAGRRARCIASPTSAATIPSTNGAPIAAGNGKKPHGNGQKPDGNGTSAVIRRRLPRRRTIESDRFMRLRLADRGDAATAAEIRPRSPTCLPARNWNRS